jgi:hypothetical protein
MRPPLENIYRDHPKQPGNGSARHLTEPVGRQSPRPTKSKTMTLPLHPSDVTPVPRAIHEVFDSKAALTPFEFDWNSDDLKRLAAKLRSISILGFTRQVPAEPDAP